MQTHSDNKSQSDTSSGNVSDGAGNLSDIQNTKLDTQNQGVDDKVNAVSDSDSSKNIDKIVCAAASQKRDLTSNKHGDKSDKKDTAKDDKKKR